MRMDFVNASLELEQEGLGPSRGLAVAGLRVHLLGRPDCLVDYEALAYDWDPAGLERAGEAILAEALGPAGQTHLLARLSGKFLALVEREGRLERVVTPDCLDLRLYHHQQGDRLVITDNPWPFIAGVDVLDPASYSRENLAWFRSKSCLPGQTYLKGLSRLLPQAVTSLEGGRVAGARLYHAPPPPRPYSQDDLYAVVGRRLGPGPYSLAYSTGVDSHYLLEQFGPRIADALTMYYVPPFQGVSKTKEVAAAFINCVERGKPLTPVPVDFDDPVNIGYVEHSVRRNPFAAHLTFLFYDLAARAQCPGILTGQNADATLAFAGTTPLPLGRFFRPREILRDRGLWRLAHIRRTVWKAYSRLEPAAQLDHYYFHGNLELVRGLTEASGYWPMQYYKMINYFQTGDCQAWFNAAACFGKSAHFPFSEPLVYHVSAYCPRPLGEVLDPKGHLRRRYSYLRWSDIAQEVTLGRPMEESLVYRHFAQEMARQAPAIKAMADEAIPGAHHVRNVFYQMVLQAIQDRRTGEAASPFSPAGTSRPPCRPDSGTSCA